MKSAPFSHLSEDGQARMVDVGGKKTTRRRARAQASVRVGKRVATLLRDRGGVHKGNVIETARIAGIMGAKQTSALIPMCHPIQLSHVDVSMRLEEDLIRIEATADCSAATGVEMEAMTAASIAALTVYDMCKSAEKGMVIEELKLLEKTGGKSGHWKTKD